MKWRSTKTMNETWTNHESYKRLCDRITRLGECDNEAETRLRLIDTILFEILDWDKGDVKVEEHCNEGYIDYSFRFNNTTALVVEAKKQKSQFLDSNSSTNGKPVPGNFFIKRFPETKNALSQAHNYATSIGSRFFAISNGDQWIFSRTFIESQNLFDRLYYIFTSWIDIQNNFDKFWPCFSKKEILNNSIYHSFCSSTKRPAPRKFSTEIPGYPQPSKRNTVINEIEYVIDKLWSVLLANEEDMIFLKKCYVETRDNNLLHQNAIDILKSRNDFDSINFSKDIQDINNIIHSINTVESKPFIILGNIGHGKTTFLNYFRTVKAINILKNYIQIQINFLDRPDSPKEVTNFIYDEIDKCLYDKSGIDINASEQVTGILHNEILRYKKSYDYTSENESSSKQKELLKDFIKSKTNDKHNFIKLALRHLKHGQKKSIAIYFDNLDRRSDEIQEEAYIKASSISRDWECAVFVCLRPETYAKSLQKGVLDSVSKKTYTLGTPDLSVVLKKRFIFAQELCTGNIKNELIEQMISTDSGKVELFKVKDFFKSCEFSSKKGSDAIEMLTAMSNGNIRELLDLTKKVLTSSHLNTSKILSIIESRGSYLIPDYEAIKTLLLGDYDHYDPKSSIFINLYDINYEDPKEHFIRTIILEFISRKDKNSDINYTTYTELKAHLSHFYYDDDVIIRHLNNLNERKCITTTPSLDFLDECKIQITNRGIFHTYKANKSFQYYDAMIIDTPILNDSYRKQILSVPSNKHLSDRLIKTEFFINYLESSLSELSPSVSVDFIKTQLFSAKTEINTLKANNSSNS